MKSAPFFSTVKGALCGAALVVFALLAGLGIYRSAFCVIPQGDAAREMVVPEPSSRSEEHADMYRSLQEQTKMLEVLQQDVDAANDNLDEISDMLREGDR